MNILSLKNIKFKSENTDIINDISLNIEKGDLVSIVGPSGSGKSTLLKLCSDLITPTQGGIYYKGKNYFDYNPTEIRKEISYCVQIPHLFGNTVYDNLAYPANIRKEEPNKIRMIELLEKLNLNESYLEKDINSLSGGEKQRVALARNLMYKPEILLLDEVTSGLDEENTLNVESFIKELNEEGITILWITHDKRQSESIFNKRVEVRQGRILEEESLA